jgi:hypothetical protein
MAAQTETATDAAATLTTPTLRTVIVIDRDLPKGLAANAAAVLAHAFGARRPDLVGGDFDDATGATHAGLIPTGLPVLGATGADLATLRTAAAERDLLVVDLPAAGQQTTDYDAFRAAVEGTDPADLTYLAVLVSGPPRTVRKLTGSLGLLR